MAEPRPNATVASSKFWTAGNTDHGIVEASPRSALPHTTTMMGAPARPPQSAGSIGVDHREPRIRTRRPCPTASLQAGCSNPVESVVVDCAECAPHGGKRRHGLALESVANGHACVLDTTVLDLSEHLKPVFGSFAAGPDAEPEDVD